MNNEDLLDIKEDLFCEEMDVIDYQQIMPLTETTMQEL